MITFSFGKFVDSGSMDMECDEHHNYPCIYVVRDGSEVLYVGKSTMGIHYRWFSYNNSSRHITCNVRQDGSMSFHGDSRIGRKVAENIPASLDWEIDLWTIKEGIDLLNAEYQYDPNKRQYWLEKYKFDGRHTIDPEWVEEWFIRDLNPKCNVANNYGERDQEVLQRYFKTIKGWKQIK